MALELAALLAPPNGSRMRQIEHTVFLLAVMGMTRGSSSTSHPPPLSRALLPARCSHPTPRAQLKDPPAQASCWRCRPTLSLPRFSLSCRLLPCHGLLRKT